MSSIKLESNASGTGVFTIASPNSNTNRTLTLPDATGTIITTAGGAAISGTTGTFTGLVDISAAGAGQIQFPATQNASSNANTLDDYEEGTWTPNIGGNATYTNQAGYYVKVGSLVLVQGAITINTIGTGSTTDISGLPFTVTNSNGFRTAGSISYYDSLNENVIALYCVAQPNDTKITFATSNASGTGMTSAFAAIFKNSAYVQFTMTYRAA